ncbi:ribonuclease H-like domain-containing protein [Tanacetum coccineum]
MKMKTNEVESDELDNAKIDDGNSGKGGRKGVDVDETFSLVVKLGTIRTVLSLAASLHWPSLLDVKNAFLHGDLSEIVYIHLPPGFWDNAHPDYVCLLQSCCDSSLFVYIHGMDTAYLLIYVDDNVLTASSQIALVVLLLEDQLHITMYFLATIYSLGPLSVIRRFLVLVQRPSEMQEIDKKQGKKGLKCNYLKDVTA